jgi:m7GpppX diphosphatase
VLIKARFRLKLKVGLPDHFHVHIVNVNYQGGLLGMTVGQAHLLDDIISLVRTTLPISSGRGTHAHQQLEVDPGVFQKMSLTYGIGDQHELLDRIEEATVQA